MIDVDSKKTLLALTTDLSMFGCFVRTKTPFPEGTSISLKITHRGVVFTTCGSVAHAQPNRGMGIAFGIVASSDQMVLDSWLSHGNRRPRIISAYFIGGM